MTSRAQQALVEAFYDELKMMLHFRFGCRPSTLDDLKDDFAKLRTEVKMLQDVYAECERILSAADNATPFPFMPNDRPP